MSYLSGTNIYLRAIEPEDLDIFISMGKRLFSMGSWMYISSILKIHSS